MPQEFFRPLRLFAALAGLSLLAACGGGGGGIGDNGGGGGGGGGPTSVTVSGRITFDRLQFQPGTDTGLNAATPVESPAREVVVEAVSAAGGAPLASTTTDSNGNYSFSVQANSTIKIRVRAQMLKTGAAPTWNFTVRNNTNSDAVYALEGDSSSTGTTNQTRDLRAPSGWNGSTYAATRAAAPFAILDTVYRAKQLILGAAPAAALPDLNLYWSTDNRSPAEQLCSDGSMPSPRCPDGSVPPPPPFCPDDGDIGTSFYFSDPTGASTDNCAPTPQVLLDGIYILGDFGGGGGDTDEFDAHVIAHEFGHYFEDMFSRSDSIGGQHIGGQRLDLRLAFGEGWGNAFSAMTLNDPLYRDSFNGVSRDFSIDLESDSAEQEGWFSEASVGEILWDLFDNNATPEAGDNVALGFSPIFAVMNGPQATTDALTSIFSFATGLRSANPTVSGVIDALLDGESIFGSNDFGAGESNNGGDPTVLPIYDTIVLNTPKSNVCSRSVAGSTDGNKLGNHRFLRFENTQSRQVTITATGATITPSAIAATDPDIFVFRRGLVAASEGTENGRETMSLTLDAGTHIIDVFDFEVTGTNQAPRCMTVSINGN